MEEFQQVISRIDRLENKIDQLGISTSALHTAFECHKVESTTKNKIIATIWGGVSGLIIFALSYIKDKF